MASVQDRLWDRIDPYVAAEGVELDDIEILGGGQIVRVTVDAADPIGVDIIAELSKGIGRLIEQDDPFTGSYTLEVSSPGLDRPLVKPDHFKQFLGEQARITMYSHVMGRRKFTGEMVEAGDDSVVVEVDGESYELPYKDMDTAR